MESILFLTNNYQTRFQDIEEYHGFKNYKHPPPIKELDTLESYLLGLVRSIRSRRVNNHMR